MNKIPSIHARGRFELKKPFHAKPDVIYEVTAIRELSDIEQQGIDVYETFYEQFGIVNGVEINGEEFDFQKEVEKKPFIITIEGTDRTIIYVPSTFIIKFPDINEQLLYSRMVIALDIGMLPDDVNLDSELKEISELAQARIGTRVTPKLVRAVSTTQPTLDQHLLMENNRKGNIKISQSNVVKLDKLKEEVNLLNKQNQTLIEIIRENGLLDRIQS